MAKTKEDYKKLLNKLKEGSGGGSKLDTTYVELQDGDNHVRVCPGHPNMDAFFVEKWQHQRGKGPTFCSVICLNGGDSRGTECLIDSEDLEPLRLSKDKDDKAKYNDQKAKPRYFMNVVNRDNENKCETLACGQQILTGILAILTNDEEYGDILDVHKGRDLIITKKGKGMDTEYTVMPRVKTSPLLPDEDDIEKLIGTSAEDTQLPDLTVLLKELEGEPDNALYIWRNGWQAFGDKQKAEGGDKPAKDAKGKPAAKKTAPPDEEVEESTEDEQPIDSYPKLKSRCAVCGEKRYNAPTGATCVHNHGGPKLEDGQKPSKPSKTYLAEFPEAEPEPEPTPMKSRCAVCGDKRFKYADGHVSCKSGHGGTALAEGARPSKPSKAYLAEFPPEPVEEEEAEEEEAPAPKPKAGTPAKTAATSSTKAATSAKSAPSADEDDEGLDDLDAILKEHTKKK